MGRPLRALIVEDVEQDAVLVVRQLTKGGFDVTFERVQTPEAMAAALAERAWDAVISDYVLPRFSAPMALELVKQRSLDLPFIIVSGTVSEDIAVAAIRAGAHDFMAKNQLARLVPAIERELRDAALRTERARMREQLLISERMASVGTLAAGVAHEINNPLAALMANLEFVSIDLAKLLDGLGAAADEGASGEQRLRASIAARLSKTADSLSDAREAAERVRHTVRDLRVLSRPDEERVGAVDVRRVLDSSLRMARSEIRHRARVTRDYGQVPAVEGNEARLGQVFLNLLVNAAQAIPEGRAHENVIAVSTRHEGDRVVIEIRDTGSGIPEADLPRIFAAFYTTKPIGVGTGLGLAICHRIVTLLGGQIEVESEVGVGSVFRTTLPVASTEAVDLPAAGERVDSPGRARVLVVDDEPMLGAAVCRILSPSHDVVAVTSAREALAQLFFGAESFDVILCDLMMPELTGMDLYEEIQRRAPEQTEKMIFMSGGAFTGRAREFLSRVPNPRMEKPFESAHLHALIGEMMRNRSRARDR